MKSLQEVFKFLSENDWKLEFLNTEWRCNREVVLETMKHNGDSLCYVSEELRKDKEIVLEAVKQYPESIYFASYELQNDADILLEIFRERPEEEQYLIEDLFLNLNVNSNKEMMKIILNNNGMYLSIFPSEEITREMAISAVNQNGKSFKFLKSEFKKDFEIIIQSVKNNGESLEFIPLEARNKRIVLEAIKQNSNSIRFVSDPILLEDEEIIEHCLIKNENCYKYLTPDSRNNRKLILKMLKKNRNLLHFLPENLQLDSEFIFASMQMYTISNTHYLDTLFIFKK
jgi:hypothetical protein